MASPTRPVIRFGVFELDLAAHALRKHGVRVKLQQQPFRVLEMLLERPGEVVRREQLQDRLWADDTFVEFDKNLSTAVQKIRRALGDSSATPRYVETVPRVGYRFMAPVETAPDREPQSQPGRRLGGPAILSLGGLFLGLLLGAMLSSSWWQPSPHQTAEQVPLQVRPLTSYPGSETQPDFSPNGNRVAFAWNGGDGGDFDIYVKAIGPGEAFRLTESPMDETNPAWSPDGRYLAFIRRRSSQEPGELWIVPALGGREQRITAIARNFVLPVRRTAWTTDSRWLIAPKLAPADGKSVALFLVSIASLEQRQLTLPPQDAAAPTSDHDPAVSPDGRWVAFVRNDSEGSNVFRIPLSRDPGATGPAERITPHSPLIRGKPTWSADGQTIIYAEHGRQTRLWRVAASGNDSPERLPIDGSDPAFSRRGDRMAFVAGGRGYNIWELPLAGPGKAAGPPRELIASSYPDVQPDFSPDGARIAFKSMRSGSHEIWIADRDGSKPTQLTAFGGPQTGTPRWSPDGRYLLFNAFLGSNKEAFVIGPDGGEPKRVTDNPAVEAMPAWSGDAGSFYIRSNRSGRNEMWKLSVDGDDAEQITHGGALSAFESADGKWLYYVNDDKLWRAPSEGGKGVLMMKDDIKYLGWRLAPEGAYYTRPALGAGQSSNEIRYIDFKSRKSSLVAELDGIIGPGMAISPDGRSLLFPKGEPRESDLMLIEGFERASSPN